MGLRCNRTSLAQGSHVCSVNEKDCVIVGCVQLTFRGEGEDPLEKWATGRRNAIQEVARWWWR